MNSTDLRALQVPPTEAEVAQIIEVLQLIPDLHLAARRLAFQRDALQVRVTQLEAALEDQRDEQQDLINRS